VPPFISIYQGVVVLKPISRPKTLTPFIDELTTPQVLHADAYAVNENNYPQLHLALQNIAVQLHSALPFCQIQGYNKQFPGPTIEVHHEQIVHIEWINGPQNSPGNKGVLDNVSTAAQSVVATYPNDQRAAVHCYRAEGLDTTQRYADAVGMWVIRDADDAAILAALNKYELLLFMQDCDLATDIHGNLTGQLLDKLAASAREHLGPYTLVNGKIWPYAEIQARPYRLRLINGSRAREFRLVLLDEGDNPRNDAIQQIGGDRGLLEQPLGLAVSEGLRLAPAGSADILVDFSRFRGKRVRLVNSATAVYPNIMEFRVNSNASGKSFATLKMPPLNK
jgi:FtsP/CotA-like multicopper oxidase with cupredoxin domain